MLAIAGFLLLQLPPGVALNNWIDVPTQTEGIPAMAATLMTVDLNTTLKRSEALLAEWPSS
jgi:hypothetical protein